MTESDQPVDGAAPERRTLRCFRHLLTFAVAGVAATAMGFGMAKGALDGTAREEALIPGVVLALLGILALPSLRSRTVVDGTGMTVVSGYRRRHFAWDEITEITADANHGFWTVNVRSSEHEATAAFFPVAPWAMTSDPGDRFHEPTGRTPPGLSELHADLWVEWQSRTGATN